MTIFYIIRHGNTELNNANILQGSKIDSQLTKEGHADALFLVKTLKNIKFDAIYASDVGRAFRTSKIIAKKLNISEKIIKDKKLREVNFGILTSLSKKEALLKYPRFKKDSKFRHPNGESYQDVKERVMKEIYKIAKKNYSKILIVTHAGCIRGIISEATKDNLDNILNKKISHRLIIRLKIKNNEIIDFKILNQ